MEKSQHVKIAESLVKQVVLYKRVPVCSDDTIPYEAHAGIIFKNLWCLVYFTPQFLKTAKFAVNLEL